MVAIVVSEEQIDLEGGCVSSRGSGAVNYLFDQQHGGIGVVVRDSNGIVRLYASKVLEAGFSPSLAESVAIHSGMLLAAESGLLPAMVESNAQSVINLILAGNSICSEIGLVIDDILDLKSWFDFTCFFFFFALRSSNRVAHCLAKMTLVHALDVVMFKEALPGLQSLVREEAIVS
ncbi:hypothetical protein ACOSQ3_009679 [Xanthoceras sorbifolium]